VSNFSQKLPIIIMGVPPIWKRGVKKVSDGAK